MSVSQKLCDEVVRQQQYLRRNCLVLEGIPPNPKETIESLMEKVKDSIEQLGIDENKCESTIDKTYCICLIINSAKRALL